jgi:agmatine deiminase
VAGCGVFCSYWTRDFGPWWIGEERRRDRQTATGIGDFLYDRPRPNDNEISMQLAQDFDVQYESSDLLLSGGNMMVDSLGFAAATDLIYEINGDDYTREEIDEEFVRVWGVQMRAHPDPTGTYIQHIDCWAKFVSSTTMLASRVPEDHPQHDEYEAAAAFYESWYDVVRLEVGSDTEPYSNSLILNDRTYVPVTGNDVLDEQALATYAFVSPPTSTIVGVPAAPSAPWQPTDALHCRTKGVPIGLPAQALQARATRGSEVGRRSRPQSRNTSQLGG